MKKWITFQLTPFICFIQCVRLVCIESCGLHLFFTLAQVACMTPHSCWYYVNKILRLCSLISTIGVCIWGVLDILEETDLQCEHYIRTVGMTSFGSQLSSLK
eukprot:UN19232